MSRTIKQKRIPNYVTTHAEQVETKVEASNKLAMGLLVASVIMACLSSILSVVSLVKAGKDD